MNPIYGQVTTALINTFLRIQFFSPKFWYVSLLTPSGCLFGNRTGMLDCRLIKILLDHHRRLSVFVCHFSWRTMSRSLVNFSFFDMWCSQGRDCKHFPLSYVTPCIVLEIYWRFGGTRCLHLRSRMSAMFLRNVGKFIPHQTAHNYVLPWSMKS